MRWILNPNSLVQVSPMATIGAAIASVKDAVRGFSSDSEGNRTYDPVDVSSRSASLNLGLVFEYRLAQQLYLRFDNQLVSAALAYAEETSQSQPKRTENTTSVGLRWTPSLQLRVEL